MHDSSIVSLLRSQPLKTKYPVLPLFDEQDHDLAMIPWRGLCGYASRVMGQRKLYRAHCMVMERILGRALVKGEMVDHVNRNRLDNRRFNLTLATRVMNAQNRSAHRNNTSGHCGVHKNKWGYVVIVGYLGRSLYVGSFRDYPDACTAADAVRDALGFWGRTNNNQPLPDDVAKKIIASFKPPRRRRKQPAPAVSGRREVQ